MKYTSFTKWYENLSHTEQLNSFLHDIEDHSSVFAAMDYIEENDISDNQQREFFRNLGDALIDKFLPTIVESINNHNIRSVWSQYYGFLDFLFYEDNLGNWLYEGKVYMCIEAMEVSQKALGTILTEEGYEEYRIVTRQAIEELENLNKFLKTIKKRIESSRKK